MKKAILIYGVMGAALAVGMASANTQPVVSNVVAAQRAHTSLVDVTFDVVDPDGAPVYITLAYSTDNGQTFASECSSVTGDVGAGIFPGTGLHVIWDAAADLPDLASAGFVVRVYADDGGGGPEGFVYVRGGTFEMGSPTTEIGRGPYENQHWVYLSPFYIARYEVTQAQYAALNPGYAVTFPNRPADNISWYDAVEFCNRLSDLEGLTRAYNTTNVLVPGADGYRLPTEAEWEFACRAGTTTPFYFGTCLDSSDEANFNGALSIYPSCNAGLNLGRAADAGSYQANGWGLYDMHGNAFEWCTDGWDVAPYPSSVYENPLINPVGSGPDNVVRGGRFSSPAAGCRSAQRNYSNPSDTNHIIGFRLVRSVD